MIAVSTIKVLRGRATLTRRNSAAGFTVIEFMVASALGLLTVASVSLLYLNSVRSEATNAAAADLSSNGRYALDTLRRDLMQAGNRVLTRALPTLPTTAIPAVAGECFVGFAINLAQPVWGVNDSNPLTTCIPAARYSTGDILVIRRAGSTPATVLDPTTLYVRSAYERAEVFLGRTAPPQFTHLPRLDSQLETVVYYVGRYAVSPTETPLIPSLRRLVLGAGPAMTDELVATNVENLQIQYVRATSNLDSRVYDADDISATTSPSQWDDVSVVRAWLLLRTTAIERGDRNTATYTLADRTITVNDGFRRQVFSTVVQLRNH